MLILRIKKTRYTNQSNKNNRIIQLNNIRFSAVVMALVFLSFSAQAQFNAVPADFDRLLVGEMVLRGNPPAASDCKAGDADTCSGVLYVRFGSAEINLDAGTGGADQLVVRMEARAGQAAIGELTTPASCRDATGTEFPDGIADSATCDQRVAFSGGTSPAQYTPEDAGTISLLSPANVMARTGIRFSYNTSLFAGTAFTGASPTCQSSAADHSSASISAISPSTGLIEGIAGNNYTTNLLGNDPADLTSDQVVVRPHDAYVEHVTVTCDLPTSSTIYNTELLDMAFEVNAFSGTNTHHDAPGREILYIVSPENSLEFFPLDGTNYITHAEITEGGDGVLIEYAQAITSSTGTYAITALDGSVITPTISDSDIIWLNDRTVWLTLGSSIYDAGVYNGDGTALNADRHVFVTSTFPGDTSFEVGGIANFGRASTYRAVLTRHMSDADLDQTAATGAPRMTVAALDYDSIELTFSRPVCGSPETGCAALTADHFEVVHYEGDISSTESATLLTIGSVTTSTGNVAILDIDSDSLPEIDSDDYLLVRTARNSRFTDGFITDRTIFSETQVTRTIPISIPAETYSEAASGMLHLQSGALVEAIPVITYSLTNDEGSSISEGGAGLARTSTFIITRAPDGVNFETTVGVTITRTSGDDPDDFSVTFDGIEVAGDGVWTEVITFAPEENVKTIEISYTGNDDGTGDSVYEIALSLPAGARIADGSISIFTIEEDDNTAPVINLADVTINESDVELDDGNVRDFDNINDYMTRGITQSSLLFSISDSVVTDDPATAATYTRVVVTLIGEGESNTAWTLTNGGDTNFGAPEETTPGKDLIYTYTPVSGRTITDITDVTSLIGKIRIVLNASEFPGITDADGTRGIEVVLNVFEEQASGTDLIGSGVAQYTLQAQNDPVQYIRPEGSPVNIEGSLADRNLAMTLVLEETATTSPYTGSLGFFTDGSAITDILTEGAGGFLTFTPRSSDDSGLLINQTFSTTNSTTIRASELGYDLEVVGGEFGRAERVVSVSDGDGSTESLTFIVEVTEAVLRFRIKVFIEGAQ